MSHADASQLAVEARDLALEEVCRLLQNPEDLTRLASLRSEYEKGRAANKQQLSSLVQSRVEAAQSSKELLDKSQKAVSKLKTCFEQIDSLCEECASLVENHEKIQQLAIAHHNIARSLLEIDDIIDLPSNAAIAEEMLMDDGLLLEAFKALSTLEGTSSLVQGAIKSNDRRSAEHENLKDYFDKVGMSAKHLEGKLREHFRNFLTLSKTNPGLLVTCNQIVEMQELIDAKLPEEGRKKFKKQATEAMEQSISNRFQPILQSCDALEPQEEETAEDVVAEILSEAERLSAELIEIYDCVAPCFPPQDKVFDRLWRSYHRRFARLLKKLAAMAHKLDNKNILEVVHWVEAHYETLRSLGVSDEELPFPPVSDSDEEASEEKGGLSVLMDVYLDRDKKSTTAWFLNILDSDVASEPKTDKDDKLWTPGFVDFFRILNDAFTVVEGETKGEMLYRSGVSALEMMHEFIAAEMAILQRDVPSHILCAFTNNNVRSYDLAVEFVEHFDDVAEEPFQETLQAEDVYRGFLEVAKCAMKKLVDGVFSDPGMVGLVKKLYQAEWQSGEITSSLVATLQDYLEELSVVLDASVTKRIVETCLSKAVGSYTSALVQRMPSITDAVVAQMLQDESALTSFFTQFLSAERVRTHVQALTNLRQLASADSVEGFVFAYLSILDANPDTAPSLVEKVCSALQDITRADANEINEQCRECFQQCQQKRQLNRPPSFETPAADSSAGSLWNKFMGL